MTILDTQEGKGTTEGGRPVMRDLLGRFPDLDAVFPINDPSALGAISAIESAGKLGKVTVVTVDGSREAIAAIQAGKLLLQLGPVSQADRPGRGRDDLRPPGRQAGPQGHQDPCEADHQGERRRVTQEPVSPCPTTATSDRPLLTLKGLTKRFGGVTALDGVDFTLRAGEIHALLGENGAGKSTLINVLGGVVRSDSGTMSVDGGRVEIRDVADADRLGIRVIHQELSLAPNLSVGENLFLGREPVRFGLVDRRRMFAEAAALIDDLGLAEIGDPEAPVATLSMARQQMVEIARALGVRSRVLILDEPTSSLSEAETGALFATLRTAARPGRGHHLHLAPARGGAPAGRPDHGAARRTDRRHPECVGARPADAGAMDGRARHQGPFPAAPLAPGRDGA